MNSGTALGEGVLTVGGGGGVLKRGGGANEGAVLNCVFIDKAMKSFLKVISVPRQKVTN